MDLKQSHLADSLITAIQSPTPEVFESLQTEDPLSREALILAALHAIETWKDGHSLQALRTTLGRIDLMEARTVSGVPIAGLAAKMGLAEVLELILEMDRSAATWKDAEDRTLLHLCLESDQCDPVSTVSLLLKAGVSSSQADFQGNTPLHLAARSGSSESLSALLTTRCNVNSQNKDGDTALHLAVRYKKNKCVEVMLVHGASSSIINFARKRPKDEAQGVTLAVFSKHEKPGMKPPSSRWPDHKTPGSWPANEFRAVKGPTEPAPSPMIRTSKPEYAAPTVVVKPKETVTVVPLDDRRLPLEKQYENERKAKEVAQERVSSLEQELLKATTQLTSLKDQLTQKKAKSEVKFLFPHILGPQDNIIPQLQHDMEQFAAEVTSWQTLCQPLFTRVVERLKKEVKTLWADCDLEEYGSFANSLHLPRSDIDLVIVGPAPGNCLQDLGMVVRMIPEFVSMSLVATAFIPVLKLEMRVSTLDIHIDITQQDPRHTGVKCSLLVREKIESIPHLREVNLAVKHLFQVCDYSEPFKGGISSYAVFLMVLYFFQYHLPPMEERFSLAEPLLHFLNYYAYIFDYQEAICVREARYDPTFFQPSMEPYLIIVDPISPTRNVGHNTSLEGLLVAVI